ncbi:ead/Ea22-like family protein [Cronobacter sakazakii]|uniref:ead/Ea22-like family protein n=1 Tax=Cronobacter sakazakii TaxID=28141 RepID=UPI001319C24A|nr:ead/Ea22-like family protein [Cronobacter sakazakii]
MNVAKLKAAALDATPGPWVETRGEVTTADYEVEVGVHLDHICNCEIIGTESPNAEFIALANPAAVLELIAALEAADRRNAELNSTLERWATDRAQSASELEAAEKRNAELDERLIRYAGIATRRAEHVAELEKRVAELEQSELQLIEERDNAEEALGNMYQAVIGELPQWSNCFGYADAVDTVSEHLGDEHDSEMKWRDLALQFDGHRMQAICFLKQILKETPETEFSSAREFLKAGPLSGEEVLRNRIAALAQPAPVVPVETFEEWSRRCEIQLTLCRQEFREVAEITWNACCAAMLAAPEAAEKRGTDMEVACELFAESKLAQIKLESALGIAQQRLAELEARKLEVIIPPRRCYDYAAVAVQQRDEQWYKALHDACDRAGINLETGGE